MTDIETEGGNQGLAKLSAAEIDLRRYEARLGVWKVVLGTLIVGLAGILIPGAINFSTVLFENWRKEAEFRLAQQTAHQQYIKDFFDTAVNQDIELRIRFANYFANLSGVEQRDFWSKYLSNLEDQRTENRKRINELEARLVALKTDPQDNVAERERVARELNWTYAEIGYVPLERGAVTVIADKKQRLYTETVSVVARLVNLDGVIDSSSDDYLRFWELYGRELMGVESREVATKMIAIGKLLKDLVQAGARPSEDLKRLSAELDELTRSEIESDTQVPARRAAAN